MKFDIEDVQDTPKVDLEPIKDLMLTIESDGLVASGDLVTIENAISGVIIPDVVRNSVTTVKSNNGVRKLLLYLASIKRDGPVVSFGESVSRLRDLVKNIKTVTVESIHHDTAKVLEELTKLYVPENIACTLQTEVKSVADMPVSAMTRKDVIDTYKDIDNRFLLYCRTYPTVPIALVCIRDMIDTILCNRCPNFNSSMIYTGTVREYLQDTIIAARRFENTDLDEMIKHLDSFKDFVSRYDDQYGGYRELVKILKIPSYLSVITTK